MRATKAMKCSRIGLTIALLTLLLGVAALQSAAEGPGWVLVTLPDKTVIRMEAALTSEERMRGLMYREKLPENEGMFFRFDEEAKHVITMKNMRFDLDVLFLSEDGEITALFESVPHPGKEREQARVPVQVSAKGSYVFELPAGSAARYGLAVGDVVLIGEISQTADGSAGRTVPDKFQ